MENKKHICGLLSVDNFEELLNFPLYFEIETSNICNARCSMCTIHNWKRSDNPFMSERLFCSIASQIIERKDFVRVVNVSRDGEPLLDNALEQKITYLKKGGIKKVTFSTNAALLTEDRAKMLLDSGLDDIMFSVDGATKETFERIRQGLIYEDVVSNILSFIKLRDKRNTSLSVRVRLVIQDDNKYELNKWGNFWRSKVSSQDRVYAKALHGWGNQLEGFEEKRVGTAESLIRPCTSTFSTMIIRYNGEVTVCPIDYDFKYKNGNLNELTIEEIWKNGAALNKFRTKHINSLRDDLIFCRNCTLWDPTTQKIF